MESGIFQTMLKAKCLLLLLFVELCYLLGRNVLIRLVGRGIGATGGHASHSGLSRL